MKLLNKYQSRSFQFALELMARLSHNAAVTGGELSDLAAASGLDYAGQVLDPLYGWELLTQAGRGCQLGADIPSVRLPMGQIERDYLQYILTLPEASLFLDEETWRLLEWEAGGDGSVFRAVQLHAPAGEGIPAQPGPEGFRTLLEAIRRRRLIRYTFRTRENREPREGITLPWKLEYSAYDRRWWVILYDPEEKRTIKARLDNLTDIRILSPAQIPEDEVAAAMERLLESEPVLLQVERTRGALERCFLVFENQMFLETRQLSSDSFRLSFRYYRFDKGEILRRLLYLGPAVKLLGPEPLRRELAELVKAALEQ